MLAEHTTSVLHSRTWLNVTKHTARTLAAIPTCTIVWRQLPSWKNNRSRRQHLDVANRAPRPGSGGGLASRSPIALRGSAAGSLSRSPVMCSTSSLWPVSVRRHTRASMSHTLQRGAQSPAFTRGALHDVLCHRQVLAVMVQVEQRGLHSAAVLGSR